MTISLPPDALVLIVGVAASGKSTFAARHSTATEVLSSDVALERNAARPSPRPPSAALRRQHKWLQSSLAAMADEGFAAVHHLRTAAEIDAAVVIRDAATSSAGTRPTPSR